MTAADSGKFVVRMAPELRDRIKAAARENGRSMNSEILLRLESQDRTSRRLWVASRILGGLAGNGSCSILDWTTASRNALEAADALIAEEAKP